MNWFDSKSLTGLFSQAQKSIDKVLDISTEEESEKTGKAGKPSGSGNVSSELQEEKSQDKKHASSAGSWLSGEDSFWGSFTTQGKTSSDKKEPEKTRGEPKTTRSTKKENTETEKENELTKKRAQNSKRINGKKSSRKKMAVDNLDQQGKGNSFIEGKQDKKIESHEHDKLKDTGDGLKEANVSKEELEIKLKEDYVFEDPLSAAASVETKSGTEKSFTIASDNGLSKDKATTEEVIVNDEFNGVMENKNDNAYIESNEDFKANEDLHVPVLTNKTTKICEEGIPDDVASLSEVSNDRTSNKNQEVIDKGVDNESVISCDELDALSSQPVAASTPCSVRIKETLMDYHGLNEENKLTNYQDLLKESETLENKVINLDHDIVGIEKEADRQSTEECLGFKMPTFNIDESNEGLDTNEVELKESESPEKENKRLLQVIDIRESKLVELSKENLNLQEANAILRSQQEQLEEMHKSEDSEFEQMKEEFTKRISDSETKLQTAAKERDLYKRRLEETQSCLGSDNERQLKEFQTLSQEKDEQIVQLMEEGEKLSKQVLQCNNNIKKLRAKEKETSELNKTTSTRLEQAESEIERLTGILKDRDEHKKNQDGAINKLNIYTKKQDEQIAKQKVELEESSAKLPSLQTALDNAYKEITELHKVNAAKSNEVQEATLSVEMTAKEELRMAMERIRKESQKACDVLAMEVSDLQTQLSRSEQQAARREDNLRQEISDLQLRLQEAETRNQELTQSMSIATRPLLRQIENLQHSYGSQQTSWEKLEKNLTERLGTTVYSEVLRKTVDGSDRRFDSPQRRSSSESSESQSQQVTAQEKERAATERSLELNSRIASLESQVGNYRQEKSRIEAELEIEKAKSETLEEFKIRETGKVGALKAMHSKQLGTMLVEKALLEQQLVVERTKFESEQKKLSKLQDQLKEKSQKMDIFSSKNEHGENEDDIFVQASSAKGRSRNTSTSSQFSISDSVNRGPSSSGTAILEELRGTIRHKEAELSSMQSAISTLEASREYLTKELTNLMTTNENLVKENGHLSESRKYFQELQTKYNALLQMYGEKQEETEELKLDLQDIKLMYKAQIQELLHVSGR